MIRRACSWRARGKLIRQGRSMLCGGRRLKHTCGTAEFALWQSTRTGVLRNRAQASSRIANGGLCGAKFPTWHRSVHAILGKASRLSLGRIWPRGRAVHHAPSVGDKYIDSFSYACNSPSLRPLPRVNPGCDVWCGPCDGIACEPGHRYSIRMIRSPNDKRC